MFESLSSNPSYRVFWEQGFDAEAPDGLHIAATTATVSMTIRVSAPYHLTDDLIPIFGSGLSLACALPNILKRQARLVGVSRTEGGLL